MKKSPHDVQLQVRLTKEEAKRLAHLAEADGVTLSAWVRRSIRQAQIPVRSWPL